MSRIMKIGFSFMFTGLLLVCCCHLENSEVIVEYHEDQIDDWDAEPNQELLSEIIKPTLKSAKAEKAGSDMKTKILDTIEYLRDEYGIYNAYCDDPIIFYNEERYIPVVELGFSLSSTNREEKAEKIRQELPIMADEIFNSIKYPFQVLCVKVKINGRVYEHQINYENYKINYLF